MNLSTRLAGIARCAHHFGFQGDALLTVAEYVSNLGVNFYYFFVKVTLALHTVLNSESYREQFIALHGVFYGENKSLLVKSRKFDYDARQAAIEAAQGF
ncbi:MAG: hypothetical protein KTR17_07755 [Cellvibrionaceae bacterium]|nr:hypothetical protein [Cellvibrionaceae bacterium]